MSSFGYVLTLAIALCWASTSLFQAADPAPDHAIRRNSTIDGLRGYLALAVVTHHDTMFAELIRTGGWAALGSTSAMLGQGGVSMFFMVTGYLFWRRLVITRGQIAWRRLYIGRVFRIGPLYVIAATIALALSLGRASHLVVPWPQLAIEIARWYALGAFLPDFDINGYRTSFLLLGVGWSLTWEWRFYAALPLLSLAVRWRWSHLVAALSVTVACGVAVALRTAFVITVTEMAYIMLFGMGMLTASLQIAGIVPKIEDRYSSCIVAGLFVIVLRNFNSAFEFWPCLLLGTAFYFVASGTSLFGALRLRASHRLGHISYGIYLLQGLVITPVFTLGGPAIAGSRVAEAVAIGVVAALLVPLSLLAHRWVELPGIRLGDHIAGIFGGEPRRGRSLPLTR